MERTRGISPLNRLTQTAGSASPSRSRGTAIPSAGPSSSIVPVATAISCVLAVRKKRGSTGQLNGLRSRREEEKGTRKLTQTLSNDVGTLDQEASDS